MPLKSKLDILSLKMPFISTRNMDDDVDVGVIVTTVCAFFQGLATLFVGARLFCRIKLLDKLYVDDWIIIISLVILPLLVAYTSFW